MESRYDIWTLLSEKIIMDWTGGNGLAYFMIVKHRECSFPALGPSLPPLISATRRPNHQLVAGPRVWTPGSRLGPGHNCGHR